MYKITHVSADDWEGVYVDGELVKEGHEVSLKEFTELLKEHNTHDVVFIFFNDYGCEGVAETGSLPENFNDIPPQFYY